VTENFAHIQDVDSNKVAAKYEIEFLTSARQIALEQSSKMASWLLSSLLAINGAGVLAVVNAYEKLDQPYVAAFLFMFGIFFALLAGLIIQTANTQSMPHLNKLLGYYVSVMDDGELLPEYEKQIKDEARPTVRIGKLAALSGWVSAILFFSAAIYFSVSVIEQPKPRAVPTSRHSPAQTHRAFLPPHS